MRGIALKGCAEIPTPGRSPGQGATAGQGGRPACLGTGPFWRGQIKGDGHGATIAPRARPFGKSRTSLPW